MDFDQARQVLQDGDQHHLLHFWSALSGPERAELLQDIGSVDWELLRRVLADRGAETSLVRTDDFAAPDVVTIARASDEIEARQRARQTGIQLLRDNQVAALTVAGGQGTRLGFAGPKGIFKITPIKGKSLFQHFAESILATNRRYDCDVLWLLMTSPINHRETVAFFEQHGFFGLAPSRVRFFEQGTMPTVSRDGKVLLAERHRVALAPDGHGGTFGALASSGLLDELHAAKVRYLSFFQVDNPLVTPLDPMFLGLVSQGSSQVGSKVVRKAYDDEKVGVFVRIGDATRVVEYSIVPDRAARRRDPDGTRTFDFANIAAHIFDVEFIRRVTADEASLVMPWYFASKTVPYIDVRSGRRVEPDQPNAFKLEQFIFDTIPLAENPLQYEVQRCDEFSPVKNAAGADSPESARRDLIAKATRWLEQCDLEFRQADPNDRPPIEISPLFALDVHQLEDRLRSTPPPDMRKPVYLGL